MTQKHEDPDSQHCLLASIVSIFPKFDADPCFTLMLIRTCHQEMYLADLDHNKYKDVPHSIWNLQYIKAFLDRQTCDSIRLNQLGIVSSWLV
jgi:hypothetical protein